VGGVDEVAGRGVGGGVSGACAGGVHGEKQLDALGWIGRTWTVIERRWPARKCGDCGFVEPFMCMSLKKIVSYAHVIKKFPSTCMLCTRNSLTHMPFWMDSVRT
jgi:hypothetical protein